MALVLGLVEYLGCAVTYTLTVTPALRTQSFECAAEDLIEEGELGRGAYGVVLKMKHKHTGTLMAVKVSFNY